MELEPAAKVDCQSQTLVTTDTQLDMLIYLSQLVLIINKDCPQQRCHNSYAFYLLTTVLTTWKDSVKQTFEDYYAM